MDQNFTPNRHRRPFRFIAAWQTHADFPNLMRRTWNRIENWVSQVPRFQGAVLRWNKEVFGDILLKKSNLDNQIAANPSPLLDQTKLAVWREYEQVLLQEELLWFQKSRSKWLFCGDRNTKYFHGVTTIRRRKNRFDLLQDSNGNWIGDPDLLEHMVTSFFCDLFTEDENRLPMPINGAFPRISDVEMRQLNKRVTRSDIYNVIKHMNPFKAPGKDGLNAGFFQSQWSFVGESFCNLVMEIFNDPSKVCAINDTLITLIPKIDPVVSIKNFRPILVSVMYPTRWLPSYWPRSSVCLWEPW